MANAGKINLYKLKYRVVYCSGMVKIIWGKVFNLFNIGEDPEYPVTELLDNSP